MYRIPIERLQPGPAEIEAEIRFYMRLYLKQRVWFVAQAVAELLDALRRHPDFNATLEQRCGFARLAKHWHCVAWIDHATMAAAGERPISDPVRASVI